LGMTGQSKARKADIFLESVDRGAVCARKVSVRGVGWWWRNIK